MWPLTLVLLSALAMQPQQSSPAQGEAYVGKIPQLMTLQDNRMFDRKVSPEDFTRQHTCYLIRSYHFRRQDGQAPVPAGVTTCTPANALRQRQVLAPPRVMYVPLGMQEHNEDNQQK
jgi:hypothetical protein